MKKNRVGFIGLGGCVGWVEKVATGCPEAEAYLVYDKDPERVQKAAAKYNVKGATSEKEFFASDVDIIVIGTPDHVHADQCIKALAAGKHVMCEKPLAPTVAQCRRVIRASRKYKRFVMTGQICRYAPAFKLAKELVTDGVIGDLVFIESEYYHDYTHAQGVDGWRKDPKIRREGFLGGGCHALDLIRWIAGDPSEVSCYMNHKLLTDWPTNDTGIAIFKYKNGVIGKVFVSVGVKAGYSMRTVIHGTRGSIICDNQSPTMKLWYEKYREKSNPLGRPWELAVGVRSHDNAGEMNEFIKYIKDGQRPPTDDVEGAKTVAFSEAALKSAKLGKPVRINFSVKG